MLAAMEFAEWVLGIVGVLVVGGVAASVKHAIDVAVIKNMLRHGDNRFDGLDKRFDKTDGEITEIKKTQKRHSERIRDLEVPPSNGSLKPHGGRR